MSLLDQLASDFWLFGSFAYTETPARKKELDHADAQLIRSKVDICKIWIEPEVAGDPRRVGG